MRFGRTNNENELDGLNAVTFSQNITVMLISVYGFLVLPFGEELPMPFYTGKTSNISEIVIWLLPS